MTKNLWQKQTRMCTYKRKKTEQKRSRECPIRKKIGCDKIFRMSDHQMEHIGDAINAVTVANTATHVHQDTSRCIFDLVIIILFSQITFNFWQFSCIVGDEFSTKPIINNCVSHKRKN